MSIIFTDDFDAGFTDENGLPARDPDKWSSWTNGIELIQDDGSWEVLDPEGQLGAGFAGTDGYGLVFRAGGGAVRQATTTSLSTVTRGGTISFNMIFGDDNNGGEDPDQLLGQSEGIFLSYSIDGGNNYTDIVHYLTTRDFDTSATPDVVYPSGATPSSYTSTPVTWTTFTVPIPTLAVGESDVRFKWQQKKYSTTDDYYDSWGLDDVVITLSSPASVSTPAPEAPCFVSNSRILLENGTEELVQNLKQGDRVMTQSGAREVLWIGKKFLSKSSLILKRRNAPIAFFPNSLGDKIPSSTLFVSEGHYFYLNGKLIAAGCLVNGINIIRVDPGTLNNGVCYWHIDLGEEQLVMSNSCWTGSYYCWYNRRGFSNYLDYDGDPDQCTKMLDMPRFVSIHDIKEDYKYLVKRALGLGNRSVLNRQKMLSVSP